MSLQCIIFLYEGYNVLSILDASHLFVVSPTLNVNPTIFAILYKIFRELYVHSVAITIIHYVDLHPNFNHPLQLRLL